LTAISTLCTSALVLKSGVPVFHGEVSGAVQKYHSFYEEELKSRSLEIVDARIRGAGSSDESVIAPGSRIVFEVEVKALTEIRDAHPGMQVLTPDGQCLFVSASSRLTNTRLNLSPGQRARIA